MYGSDRESFAEEEGYYLVKDNDGSFTYVILTKQKKIFYVIKMKKH